MKRIGQTPNSNTKSRNHNVIDFSKKKRDLSHIQGPKKTTVTKTANISKANATKSKTNVVKENKIRVNLLKVLSVVTLLLLLASSIYVFLNSQYALLQKIVLTGNFLLEEQEILASLPKEGQANFYKTSKESYKEALKDNLWVKKVEIDKDFIQREVNVKIEERRPLFRTLDGTEVSIIDEDGLILPNLPGISTINVPFVTGTNEQDDLKYIIDHLKEIPDHFLYMVSEINAENMNSVVLYTVDGFVIKVGVISNLSSQRTEEIIRIMGIQKQNEQEGTIDIRGHNIIFEPHLEG